MSVVDTQLYQTLLDNQYVEENKLKEARALAVTEKISLYEALVKQDIISDENLGRVIADIVKLPFVTLSKTAIQKEVLMILPESVATKQQAICFGQDKDAIKIATANPENDEFFANITKKTGLKVSAYYATERDIQDTLRLYKKELQSTFDILLKTQVAQTGRGAVKEVSVAKIVDTLIDYASDDKASDIHIEPEEDQSIIRFRIDGILHDVVKLPKKLHDQIVTRIKVLSKLRTDEHLSAQDGKMQVKLREEELDIRVSIVPVVEGEKVVLRLLSSHSRQFSLMDLGMSERGLTIVKNNYIKPYGMILATGPTGSGKTTTIYAILKQLNVREKNIATIEDPVEYQIEGVNQIQVNPKTNLTFASGLRAILRQDPDIIFVGEIRDEETASIAVNSAMTGHLVLSTLHTNNATTTIPRLIDMNIEPFLVASTVNVIIAQRLVRKICEKCRVSDVMNLAAVTAHISKELIEKHFGQKDEYRLYKGKGCEVCHNTGYAGRVGVFEILEVTDNIRALINEKASADILEKKAIEEGMQTMLEDGLEKIAKGITTIEEVLRATRE